MALSSVITPTAGVPFGKDPLVCRFFKGVFELKPSLPKYCEIWDVNKVLCYLQRVSSVNRISLKDLSMNLSTLLCLLTGQRCHKININYIQFIDNRCIINIREVLKHTKAGKHQVPLELRSYPKDKRVCVVEYLQEYIKRTATLRGDESQLLVSFAKPHKPVTKDTIARWIKSILKKSGIDTDKFTSHRTRAASTSRVKAAGLNLQQIIASAGWSNSSTFMIRILKLKILVHVTEHRLTCKLKFHWIGILRVISQERSHMRSFYGIVPFPPVTLRSVCSCTRYV